MIRKNYILTCFLLLVQIGFSQIKINTNIGTTTINTDSAFLDASSSPTWNGSATYGKGLIFPRVNLTTLLILSQAGSRSATNNPNRFDGMLVYNTATGTSGIGAVAVKPGFYYYSNSSTSLNGGTWLPVVSKDTSVVTKTNSYMLVDSDSTVLCNAATVPFTLTLLDPVGNSGKVYIIRKTDVTDNAITFSPSLVFSQGVTVSSLNYVKTIRVQSDGTNWNIID